MTPERFRVVHRVLADALELPPEARDAYLGEACAGDPDLRTEVESLLAAAAGVGDFLERDVLEHAATLLERKPAGSLAGSRLGPYLLERRLGSGGMGEVYLAHDERLDRKVALKLLAPGLADGSWRVRFLREARLASALDHPNVCTIHDVGEAEGMAFIAMQYVDGRTLKEVIGGRPLPPDTWVSLALQIADALSAAHARGIVHRDVKSSNVMVTPAGQAKVLDFGIAKHLADPSTSTTAQLTVPGMVLGTPGSMAPEQAAGSGADPRSDIFSLGVVLYEMATGTAPFVGFSISEVLRAVVATPHEPASLRNPQLSSELSRVIDRALAKDPAQRYPTMAELLADLRDAAGLVGGKGGRPRRLVIAAGAISLAAVAIVAGLLLRAPSTEPIHSLTVLPFRPLVAGQTEKALELGMADTLIGRLETLPGVTVRPIGAVMRYAGRELDPAAVGREQRTDAVLDGHIQKDGEAVRLTVRLVRAADGKALWSDRFDAPMTGLFAVQDSIAERVAGELTPRLSGTARARLVEHQTDDPEAYRLYLLGRYHLSRLTDEGFRKSLTYFQQAEDRDPRFAAAFAGEADAYYSLGAFDVEPPGATFPHSKRAAERALRLDDRLAGAHVALGNVLLLYDWQWKAAEDEFQRALALAPESPDAHQMYSQFLTTVGRNADAVREMERAQELDPLTVARIASLGEVLFLSRRFREAEAQQRRALEMDPNFGFAYWGLGRALHLQRRYSEAVAAFQKSIPLSGDSPDEPASLAVVYAESGQRQQALAIADSLERRAGRQQISPAVLAMIYGALGERDKAFAYLERSFQQRDFMVTLLDADPEYDSLRSDPRFEALARRVGLPR
jgi:serine/threonine-protein kinase